MKAFAENYRGVLFCALAAIPCWYLGKLMPVIGGPVFAILLGMLIGAFYQDRSAVQAGVAYTSKKILQYAVILLGFGMNLTDILMRGQQSLPIIITTITTSLLISFILCRALCIPRKIATLVGVGSSICGGSAIAAAAPVINADDEEISQAISVIFLFNVCAALIFPAIGGWLDMSNEGFGIFAGTAVNDTSSVTAAAAAWDGMHASNALEVAAIVKLTRTLAIIPITMGLAVYYGLESRREGQAAGSYSLKKIFPMFVIFFILASVLTTLLQLSPAVTSPLKDLSKYFIMMAMFAIGLNTNLLKLIRSGGKPIFLGLCCWLGIALVSLMMQHVLGIW